MDNFQVLTTERLRALIHETDITLGELTEELERREAAKQEHAIENLEQHMESAELSLKKIRDFLAFLAQDFRKERP